MYTDNPTNRPFDRPAGWAAEAANRNERISTPREGKTKCKLRSCSAEDKIKPTTSQDVADATTHGWWSSFDR